MYIHVYIDSLFHMFFQDIRQELLDEIHLETDGDPVRCSRMDVLAARYDGASHAVYSARKSPVKCMPEYILAYSKR